MNFAITWIHSKRDRLAEFRNSWRGVRALGTTSARRAIASDFGDIRNL
jgi:hypothetical protein